MSPWLGFCLLLGLRIDLSFKISQEMNRLVYNKRGVVAQNEHDEFVRRQLQSLSNSEPEFLGYAENDHRLAKKEFGIHSRVPMFRFEHFKHGSMEMTPGTPLMAPSLLPRTVAIPPIFWAVARYRT